MQTFNRVMGYRAGMTEYATSLALDHPEAAHQYIAGGDTTKDFIAFAAAERAVNNPDLAQQYINAGLTTPELISLQESAYRGKQEIYNQISQEIIQGFPGTGNISFRDLNPSFVNKTMQECLLDYEDMLEICELANISRQSASQVNEPAQSTTSAPVAKVPSDVKYSPVSEDAQLAGYSDNVRNMKKPPDMSLEDFRALQDDMERRHRLHEETNEMMRQTDKRVAAEEAKRLAKYTSEGARNMQRPIGMSQADFIKLQDEMEHRHRLAVENYQMMVETSKRVNEEEAKRLAKYTSEEVRNMQRPIGMSQADFIKLQDETERKYRLAVGSNKTSLKTNEQTANTENKPKRKSIWASISSFFKNLFRKKKK